MLEEDFIVIPNSVVSDDNLKPIDKILFGQIYSLSKETGYCWATNNYIGNKIRCSKGYISQGVSLLERLKYINVLYNKNESNSYKRKVFINFDYLNLKQIEYKKSIKK